MANQKLIEGLNHALNREVSTCLRYMLQAAIIQGAQWENVRSIYESEIDDELGHARYLAGKIAMLGGKPTLHPDLSNPPTDVPTMLQRDIEEEHKDVEHYTRMAELAGKAGLADLKLKMEEQAADEARHGDQMQRMLGVPA
jgi:bacterioferritin